MKKAALALLLVLFAVPAMAETYMWTDERGTVNFAEDLGRVPKKYRKKARLLDSSESESIPAEPVAEPDRKAVPRDEPKEAVKAPAKDDKKKLYDGKEGAEWNREFGRLRSELKSAEDQLVDTRKRLDDTSSMSRNEYLSLQVTIRNMERRVLELRKKVEDFEAAATKAEVPPDLWQ